MSLVRRGLFGHDSLHLRKAPKAFLRFQKKAKLIRLVCQDKDSMYSIRQFVLKNLQVFLVHLGSAFGHRHTF